MSNLEEDDIRVATSKAASSSCGSSSDSSNSEEEMETETDLLVSSRQDPDPIPTKSSDDTSLTGSPSNLPRDGDRSDRMSGARGSLTAEENSTGDGAGRPKEGPVADESTGTAEQTFKGPVSVLSAGDKAHAYLKKRRDELICELKSSLGTTLLTYEAVNLANKKRLSAPYLQSGEAAVDDHQEAEGDFFSTGDGRVRLMYMDCNLPRKRNIAYSFNPWELLCTGCRAFNSHPVMGARQGSRDGRAGREVIILSDQTYPPATPSSSELGCIRIIRLEHGSIPDLCGALLDLLNGRVLNPGSIVLIFSATHLAQVGLTAYVTDLVAAKRRLYSSVGKDVYFAAAPPLLITGTNNKELVNNIFALTGWTTSAMPEETRLSVASSIALEVILESGQGGFQEASNSRARLPARADSHEPTKVWCIGSASNSKLPCKVKPATTSQEERVITGLVSELQLNLALDLDSNPVFDRNPTPKENSSSSTFLVVGSSNARRLNDAFKRRNIATGFVFTQNWRATKKSVQDLADHVKEEMGNRSYTAVVFQLLDNNIFFELGEDGSRAAPKKGPDGKFHVMGDLAVADRDGQLAILKLCEPLWEAARGKHMIIVGPLARYVTGSCCSESDHVGNRRRPDFYVKMREQLASCSNNIKDYLFTSGQRNGRVMDPARSLRGLAAAEIWGEDPIHPREEIYDLLAEGIQHVEKSCGSGSSKRKRPEAPPGDNSVSSRSSGPPSGGEGGSYSNNNFNQVPLLAGD